MLAGRFITFEGGEGSGKSTQAQRLAASLRQQGRDVLVTREPGGSPFAERVRALLLDPAIPAHDALADALLFYAARADHLATVIRPALAAGRWVIADRFSDSTRVYQVLAGGLDPAHFETLEQMVVGSTRPDLTLVLDLPAELGLARADGRRQSGRAGAAITEADPFEGRDLAFHRRLRSGFEAIVREEPERCVLIDASGDEDAIAAAIATAVAGRLGDR